MEENTERSTKAEISWKEKLEDSLTCGELDRVCAEIEQIGPTSVKNEIEDFIDNNLSRQVIFYGAPGTGKSFIVNVLTKPFDTIRTTFHPESDYASFVGCYKPVSVDCGRGKRTIDYAFVEQAFVKAYIAARKNQSEKHFLIIEEINRGNCAAIFGDLFQLLDRDDDGNSKYPIESDSDLKEYLKKKISSFDGKISLPPNLYIWATMNTSDQSLFPMDSAFKRRWDMEYARITDAGKKWLIEVKQGEFKPWIEFVKWVNREILDKTLSQDKQIGYFFVKANKNGIISRRQFVNKVLFYLWNDVFRDYIKEDTLFNLSNCRSESDSGKIKEKLGKEPYMIESFEQFFDESASSDFLWHLPSIEKKVDTDTDKRSSFKDIKEENIEKVYLERTDGTPPTTPGDKPVIYKVGADHYYTLKKGDNSIILGLYYITKEDSVESTIEKWKSKIGEGRPDYSKWIGSEPLNTKRGFKIETVDGDTLYLNDNTSIGAGNWKTIKTIAEKLGVTILTRKKDKV